MEIKILKQPISKKEFEEFAKSQYTILVKAVVDIEKEIMALGGEMHADGETLLVEEENSKGNNVWGINIYTERNKDKWIEFDSMVNIKPSLGNRSRDIENFAIKNKIKQIVEKLIV